MPLPVISGTVRASFRGGNIAGQQWVNVMHFQYAAGASSPGLAEVTALDTKVVRLYTGTIYTGGIAWLTLCPVGTTLIDATYYVLNGTATPIVIAHSAAGAASATTNQPPEVAHVLTLRTAQRGRKYRGRIYYPAVGTGSMAGANGTLSSTVPTQAVAQAVGLQTDLASIQWVWGVASYGKGTLHGQPTTWAPFFTPIQTFSMDAVADVQRRRKQ